MRTVIKKFQKFVKKFIKSADEKLRSLSHKGHHSSKTNTNTYCGAQNGQSSSPGGAFVTSSRSEAPDVPPPPIPHVTTNQIQQNQSHDQKPHHETTNQNRSNRSSVIILETAESEIPPPIFPKPHVTQMAERRLQRQNRKSGSQDENVQLKKRSRSEGPHGRRKLRNSMHETSNKVSPNKSASNGRHSMYTGHMSDDDNAIMVSGSESPDSDIVDQRWTKNPLMSRKARKSEKNSKTDKRRSVHNVESPNSNMEQSGPNSYQVSQSRDFFIQPRKPDPFQGQSNKAKFLRMEENRKKRIDMAVTSDEECSPQLRISRLRQRAIMSSHLGDNQRFEDSLNIVPVRDESSLKSYQEFTNGLSQVDKSLRNRVSQYDENRQSKYDENYNVNGNFYQEYTRQQGVKHNKLPNVLPEFLPENRDRANLTSRNFQNVPSADHVTKNILVQNKNLQSGQLKSEKQLRHQGVKMSNDSPKLRSFTEVKANQPTQLKKADQKIELNPRSPNSSSDSLDDLIESNIQYLESEIESGKLKRQSGNYSQERVVQRQVREPFQINQKQEEFRSQLQDPRTFVSNKLMSTVTKVEPKIIQKSTMYPQSGMSYSSQYQNSRQTSSSMTDHRNVPPSGSATYSPYMQRKTYDVNEDISKSDSHLNAFNSNFNSVPTAFQPAKSYAPYPVLNKETGNITYIQPTDSIEDQMQMHENGTMVDSGMFSDVEYNIEVSERIKKWEKKLTPGELEERHKVLNTIKEYESFSDSNQKDSVPDTPVEVRRELWQLVSPTSNSGVGKLSVNLTRSTSSISDSNMQDPSSAQYFEPKVVSSETNLHRIFRVVNEPRRRPVTKTIKVKPSTESHDTNIQNRSRRKPPEVASHAQSLSNVTLSESEIGSNMQQSWPPMVVDSDSGIRKSWRMSRYEDEINELKELVSDNFRDIRKRFDSDMSETDTKRASPVFREPQVQAPMAVSVPVTSQTSSGMSKLTLNIQPVTPTNQRSPVTIRRKLSDQRQDRTPPASPAVPVTPKNERKVPIFRNVPIETKSISTVIQSPIKQTTVPDLKQSSSADSKIPPDIWSPNMESRKGLVSMERVKARTLQTIPFSEDPVWKEIEGLATFDKPDEISREVNFDEIDELLKLATGGVDNLKARSKPNLVFDDQMRKLSASDNIAPHQSTQQEILMTQSFTPTTHMQVPKEKHRALSDSTYPPPSNKHVFHPPTIQPLKLNSKSSKKSSTSALDEVLEDIRATLQKKPLSPKLMKNLDTSESNSSTNLSLQSPLTKSSKSFIFPKDIKRAKTETVPENPEVVKSAAATPGYDNTSASWKPAENELPPQALQQLANTTYIDPEFTQFPYIINGNYHLDPKLLSEKLKSTGLANDSSDELLLKRKKAFDLPANHQALNLEKNQPANLVNRPETVKQSNPITHELDQSVDDLRSLAQEVEFKLSQIKSRIVSADEDRLDSILLALRKFAPMTEEKFFNVKFTPNYESDKARRSKLEDALNELEKMYESLDLDDKSLMDRASRRDDTVEYENRQGIKSNVQNISVFKPSQIDEIEKDKLKNEFEDITKSFQVLLDEVTKQCRQCLHKGSSLHTRGVQIQTCSPQRVSFSIFKSAPPMKYDKNHETTCLKVDAFNNELSRIVYNTAIKELESVLQETNRPNRQNQQLQDQSQKMHLAESLEMSIKCLASLQVELSEEKPQVRGSGRFRKRGNIEHRKSMPAITRNVETQTVETQTESPPNVSEMKEKFEQYRKASLQEMSSDSSPDFKLGRYQVDKASVDISHDDISSSDDEDDVTRKSKMRRSLSCPDIVALLEEFNRKEKEKEKRLAKVDKTNAKKGTKSSTPKSVKQRHENKLRFRSLHKDDAKVKQTDISMSAASDDGFETPKNKPPVYPVWKYPGQVESSKTESVKKSEQKKQAFGVDRDFTKTTSDTEQDRVFLQTSDQGCTGIDERVIRRRSRSFGGEQQDPEDRPKSFHELVATFEQNPKRLEKIRTSGLRKCASEDSMFTDLILQKIYHSETDLYTDEKGQRLSGSGLKLALEMKVKD
ncbi:LOW QUALITY PROTEIN: uncharacterized protein LOC132740605 [Ruditapes philippinarum]|uniref:LOW QUALITY PROTEIN: uncharacterized protein LOC132740605 n=1 Tax=Ruditapes philippinarum TaxID=129788 RepID=UPI00295ADC77|nr:LOW QUALITY PROTEIN: uncharacterized protein LOC132740605 [Ruditapes philippinarum]